MGSEVFKLKSLDLEPTVVRGARSGIKNAKATSPLYVNPGDPARVYSGERGVTREYLVQSSLSTNDFKGEAVFTNNSDVVSGYTAPYAAVHGNIIRHDGDTKFYTVTGIDGTNVYLTEKYAKQAQSDPDVVSGVCTVRRTTLGSVNYESYEGSGTGVPFYFDKDISEWRPTGVDPYGPFVCYSSPVLFSTGIDIQFDKASSKVNPDISTIGSVRKTLVENSSQDLYDVSLSPIPYPHSSLMVWWGIGESGLQKKTEFKDYVVNYSQSPDFAYPYPPYENRKVAYLKFLDELRDEVQITGIGPSMAGVVAVSKEVAVQSSGSVSRKPVQRIIYGTDSVKIGSDNLKRDHDYIMDYDAGTLVLVNHSHAEMPYDHLSVPRRIFWDGVSVIRSVTIDEVRNTEDLVIPGVTGLLGFDGAAYFEDTDENNLIPGIDYTIEYTSGAIQLSTPLKKGQAVLVSYYVEGEDVETEQIGASDTRLNKYPILKDSVTVLKKWTRTDQYGKIESGSSILVEGTDYELSYFTGHIKFFSPSAYAEDVTSIEVSYTPLSLINCILQSKESDKAVYRMTLVDDALEIIEAKEYIFKVYNPAVSVPIEDPFKKKGDPSKYTFKGTILSDAPLHVKILNSGKVLNSNNWSYNDQTRLISLDKSLNNNEILKNDIVVCTYTFESDVLPYAPVQITYPVIFGGTSEFLVEGFDRTDVVKPDTILRIDNLDPVARYYYRVKDASYGPEGTRIIVYGVFPEDINAPQFYVLDAPVSWTPLPDGSVVDSTSLVGSDQITISRTALEVQHTLKSGTLLMVDGMDIYSVTSVDISGEDAIVGIQPPLVRSYPSSVVRSRTPVYDVGDTILSMRHYVLADVPEPAFTVSYVSPDGFDGSGGVFVDAENIVLFESINGVPNNVPYIFRKADYSSVEDLAYAIQSTPSRYNECVKIGPRVPDYNPFTVCPVDLGEKQYFLDNGVYSADKISAFDQQYIVGMPYTFTITPELLRWSLLLCYRGQSSITVRKTDLRSRFFHGDVMAFAGEGHTGVEYLGITGVSAETDGDVMVSKIFFNDVFRSNLFDPSLYVKRGVSWVDVPNDVLSVSDDRTLVVLSGDFRSMLKPGTLLRFGGKYIHAVERVTRDDSLNTIALNIYPALKQGHTVVGRPGYRIEQTEIPICLFQTPDQPHIDLTYTPPPLQVGYARVWIEHDKILLRETLNNFSTRDTVLMFSDFENLVELAQAIESVESQEQGWKPFKASIRDEYKTILSADHFNQYLLDRCAEVVLPYVAKVAKGSAHIEYQAPAGFTGVGFFVADSEYASVIENVMPVSGGSVLTKNTVFMYSECPTFYDVLARISAVESAAVPGFTPFRVVDSNSRRFLGSGAWDHVHTKNLYGEHKVLPTYYYATTDFERWEAQAPLNIRRLEPDTDYTIESGLVTLEEPIAEFERFSLSYMGRDTRYKDNGKPLSVSCRYFSALPKGSRLDVYMDYKAVDQFYLQKLTERQFSDMVVVPQLQEILDQMGSGNGQGADTAPADDAIRNWLAGVVSIPYLLQDEEIKRQLFLKFYHWYKQRLRNFASELQLTMGFKFGKSNAVGTVDGRLTLQDPYVENDDYNLTTDDEIASVPSGFSKFFPMGYGEQAPKYYPRFGKEYRLYNDVYCFNVHYRYKNGNVSKVGYIKAIKPYWTKDLDHVILKNANNRLVAYYDVPIPESERTFAATDSKYTWLKRLSVGDKINLYGRPKKYTIMEITSGVDSKTGHTYELIRLDAPLSEKGVKTYRLRQDDDGKFYFYIKITIPVPPFVVPAEKKPESDFMASLPGEGRNVVLTRAEAESFPVFDDEGSYGYKIEAGVIEGYDKHDRRKNRIRKFSLADFLKALFPLIQLPELPENVRVEVGTYNEDTLEFTPIGGTTSINIARLNLREQRKVSSTQEALYKNRLDDDQLLSGIDKFAFLDFETVYTPDDDEGYIEAFVLRSKNRDLWLRFVVEYDSNGSPEATDVAEEYGFIGNQIYRGFYDPDNIYRWLLMEKQAWQTEEAILKDLYDYNDKIARAFKQARMRLDSISPYKGYLAYYQAGKPAGISDWLAVRLTKYERALYFLIGGYAGYGDAGSVLGIMRPDGVHDENEASPQIAQSYTNASAALSKYLSFYGALQEYKYINAVNNQTWKTDYVRWVLSVVEGLMHQKTARSMYESTGVLKIGLVETNALSFRVVANTKYAVVEGTYSVIGDSLYLYAVLKDVQNPLKLVPPYSRSFSLKTADGAAYITLAELAELVSSTLYDGVQLFSMTSIYSHHPYTEETCRLMLRGSWALALDAANYLSLTNVDDHRQSDPRILFLNRMIEDKLTTDNNTDPRNPYWVWPLYTANGNAAKKAIEGLPVSGEWERPTNVFYDVIKIRCPDSEWSVRFEDFGNDGSGVIDAKTYMGPQYIVEKISRQHSITKEEFTILQNSVELDTPRVTILKAMTLVRHGVQDVSLSLDLRQYATIDDLVAAINAARFDSDGTQNLNGTLQYFEAERVGDEKHGKFKSYEIQVYYDSVRDFFTVVDDNGDIVDTKFNYPVGWKLVEKTEKASNYMTFSVKPQKYSVDSTANFFVHDPARAYWNTLNNFPLGLRKDIDAFDVYCWDDVNSDGQREYEIRDNVMYFRSANVPNVAIPLAGSGSEGVSDRETLKHLVDRINSNPVISKYFYANLKFTREDTSNPGYFEYGYLPNFRKSIPKSALQDFTLRKDNVLRLSSSENVEYMIEPDGSYDPSDMDTIFKSLKLHIRSSVRGLSVSRGSGYMFFSSSMVIDDAADTLDLSAEYTYTYQYSKTFQFSDDSCDTVGELVSAINATTIPGVGGALFTASLDTGGGESSTLLLQASGSVTSSPLSVQLYEQNTSPPPSTLNAFKLSVAPSAGVYTISGATYRIPAARSQITLSCTITYTDTYAPATIDISTGNYTLSTLAEYISSLKPYPTPEFQAIFPAVVYNTQYGDTDASNLMDVTTDIKPVGYASVKALKTYILTGKTLDNIASEVTEDKALTGVLCEVVGKYGSVSANLLVPTESYLPLGAMNDLFADMRGIVGLRLLNMFNPSYATVYDDRIKIIADGDYESVLPTETKDLHAWVNSVRGDLMSGMLGVQVLPIKVDAVSYGLLSQQSKSLTYNEPTNVYFGIMGDIKFVQISDHNLHVQTNNVKRRLGKPWKVDGVVQLDHYTPERYDDLSNENAIDMEHFLGWLRNTRYTQIRDGVVNEELVSNKYLWLFLKLHREIGCDQKAYQYRKRIEHMKKNRTSIWPAL